MQNIWDIIWDPKVSLFAEQSGTQFDKINGQYMAKLKTGKGGGVAGWHRPESGKYEADPTKLVTQDTMVYISPGAALVVTGIRDAANPTGPLVKSCSGWWLALRDVPAQTVVGGNNVWNLPQNPYPNPAPPVMDNIQNFWAYFGDINC